MKASRSMGKTSVVRRTPAARDKRDARRVAAGFGLRQNGLLKAVVLAAALLPAACACADGVVVADDATNALPCAARGTAVTNMTFAGGNLFSGEYKNPLGKKEKQLWATSFLYDPAPPIVAESWIGDKPDTKGKYVLLEIWNTWCPPCRRSIALMNKLHARFGEELVVIGLCDESSDAVRTMMEQRPECRIEYYNAIDTKGTTKQALGVVGVPHAIVIEPGGCVVWEGFPLQSGYELTETIVDRILAVGRAQNATE